MASETRGMAGQAAAQDELKLRAARRAADLVEDGMKLGLGTGSTARLVLEALAVRRERGELTDIVGVPTSIATRDDALRLGIPLTSLDVEPRLDMTLDGADEVDPALDLIKGLGGALLREKIVAAATDRVVIVVDESKLVDRLGTRSPLPVQVVPFGWRTALAPIAEVGARPELRLTADGSPFSTDDGHYIIDCHFPHGIGDAQATETRLLRCPAVVETGLFLGMASTVVVAAPGDVRLLEREAAS
jgi:ribose 5-phosphate isomerase A